MAEKSVLRKDATGKDATVLHTILRNFEGLKDKQAFGWLSKDCYVDWSCSYGELDRKSQELARGLLSTMQEKECTSKTVVLCYTHGPEFIVAFLGCLRAGLIPGLFVAMLINLPLLCTV